MTSHSKIQSGVGTVLESEEIMNITPTLDKEIKTVYCLYRVSTKGQVDKNDIPMQKQLQRIRGTSARMGNQERVSGKGSVGLQGFS